MRFEFDRQIRRAVRGITIALLVATAGSALAADVTAPARVNGVLASPGSGDVQLTWNAVTTDRAGNPEVVATYHVYRGTTPTFVPDTVGGSNRVGIASGTTFSDLGAVGDPASYYYLVSALDADGNESNTRPASISTIPVLSGDWSDTAITIDWTAAAPSGNVDRYRVYYGKAPGEYESVDDVGTATAHSLTGLETFAAWYIAVTAVDLDGNETPFSNEHVDAIAGVVRLRPHEGDELCWDGDGSDCAPFDPDKIQRNGGFQLLAPVQFPPGDWTSVEFTLTMESRLCVPPNEGTVTKCGDFNPCPTPPCNGNPGYNPCGDPWDRIFQAFLVLDDCVDTGGSCITPNNLELIHGATPFGTDADTDSGGNGQVPPRSLTMDVTPFAPLMSGPMHVGAEIVHFTQGSWWVSTEFVLSKRTDMASSKKPADGIEIVGFGGAPLPSKTVAVPASAQTVKARIFTSGHGGSPFCVGGSADGQPCSTGCPGGFCGNCDEFCQRTNSLNVFGFPIWQAAPWRTDCNAAPGCNTWNACGLQSCTGSRAGWCPGYIACHTNAPCDNDVNLTNKLMPGGSYDIDYTVTAQTGYWPVSVVVFWYDTVEP